jgi:NADH-quinone oxidoreductase subunit D
VATNLLLGIGTVAGLDCDAELVLDTHHPARHPGFLLQITVDADDVVTSADPQVGFMHRSAEKLFESRDLRQAMLLADRHDWLSSFTSELVTALAIEEALGMLPPERATWTRMLLAEVERIQATIPFLSVAAGTARPSMEAMRARITSILESITGARMHPGFARIGGVGAAIADDDRAALRSALVDLESQVHEWQQAVDGETVDLEGIAVLTADQAVGFGLGGPVGRASGVDLDLRRDDPYLAYADLAEVVEVPVRAEGDARARYLVLADQLPVTARLALACLDRLDELGEGPVDTPLPKVVRLPEGTTYASVEGPLGISGILLVGAGDKYPWRMKIRSASFATMQAMTTALVGVPRTDLADAVMSLPVVTGDVDR